jgi:anti-sigma B factor antagonist
MNLQTTLHGDTVAVLRCDGRLNMVTAPLLRSTVQQSIEQGRARIVVDLATTSFIDSSGLGALVSGLKQARQAGGDLRIAGPTVQVKTVLRLTNLDRVLTPHERVEDATHDW